MLTLVREDCPSLVAQKRSQGRQTIEKILSFKSLKREFSRFGKNASFCKILLNLKKAASDTS